MGNCADDTRTVILVRSLLTELILIASFLLGKLPGTFQVVCIDIHDATPSVSAPAHSRLSRQALGHILWYGPRVILFDRLLLLAGHRLGSRMYREELLLLDFHGTGRAFLVIRHWEPPSAHRRQRRFPSDPDST